MRLLFLLACLCLPLVGISQVKRVAGNYVVDSIEAIGNSRVKVTFTSETSTGNYDKLVLVSDHVHMGIRVNDKLRLSAEIIRSDAKGESLVSQVLVFLPSRHGSTPVWLLSKTHPPSNLSGARLLEMHAPSADYRIF